MYSWQDFRTAEPLLIQVEQTYAQLLRFEETHDHDSYQVHGFENQDVTQVSESVLTMIREELGRLPGKVYYWLLPFYSGNFHVLTQALERAGTRYEAKDTRKSRQVFYRFFLSLPEEQRLRLGTHIKSPELIKRSEEIRTEISRQKSKLKDLLDRRHAN